MWNEDGTFMSRGAFEAKLEEMIASSSVLESGRAFFLERFDFCSTYRVCGACGRNSNGGARCVRTGVLQAAESAYVKRRTNNFWKPLTLAQITKAPYYKAYIL